MKKGAFALLSALVILISVMLAACGENDSVGQMEGVPVDYDEVPVEEASGTVSYESAALEENDSIGQMEGVPVDYDEVPVEEASGIVSYEPAASGT